MARMAPVVKTPRVWTADDMIAMLKDMTVERNRIFAERAVCKLLARQTEDERVVKSTRHTNGIGFNGPDAAYLTWCAEWIQNSRRPEGSRLNVTAGEKGAADRHYPKMAKKLMKYTRQLLEEVEVKQAA